MGVPRRYAALSAMTPFPVPTHIGSSVDTPYHPPRLVRTRTGQFQVISSSARRG